MSQAPVEPKAMMGLKEPKATTETKAIKASPLKVRKAKKVSLSKVSLESKVIKAKKVTLSKVKKAKLELA